MHWRAVVFLVGLTLAATGAPGPWAAPAAPSVHLTDLDNRIVDPFASSSNAQAIAFIFASVSCPISNRYAPDIRRLDETFSAKGVAFWLVYPNPMESPAEIRAHLKDFGYPMRALRDPRHELVKLTKVAMTPEAAVYDRRTLSLALPVLDPTGREFPARSAPQIECRIVATGRWFCCVYVRLMKGGITIGISKRIREGGNVLRLISRTELIRLERKI